MGIIITLDVVRKKKKRPNVKEKDICSTMTGWKEGLKAKPVITENFP